MSSAATRAELEDGQRALARSVLLLCLALFFIMSTLDKKATKDSVDYLYLRSRVNELERREFERENPRPNRRKEKVA